MALAIVGSCFWINIVSNNINIQKTNKQITVSNQHISISFSNTDTYQFQEMKVNNVNLLSTTSTHPWQITYIGPNGENPALQPKNGYYKGIEIKETSSEASLIFTWQMLLEADTTHTVRMIVSINDDSELIKWDFEADLPNGWIVSGLDFPRISIAKPENPKAILSAGWGAEYSLSGSTTLNSRYPSGTGTMQMLLVHDGQSSFFYSTQDQGASDKRYTIQSTSSDIIFNTTIITSEGWSPQGGGTFQLPWRTVFGYNKEGWEKAVVDWYRPFTYTTEWGSKTLASRNLPNWIYNADMWLRPMNATPEVMDAVRKSMKVFGKGVGLHWYYWHHAPFDTKYPEYFPVKEGFIDMVKETNKLGGHVTPYINGRLWDPATKSYQTEKGYDASCRKADGTLYTEVYSSKVINTVTCPSSDIWRNIQKETIYKIQDEIGTSGVYVDQVAAAPAEPCWAENHNHPKGGGEFWHSAYRSLYKEIRENYLKKNNILTSEENAECYIDLFDMLLIVNSPIRHSKLVPLFPMVYSDRVITSAFAYTPGNLTTGYFRYLNMMSLLWGAQLGWVDPTTLVKDESKEEMMFLKDMVDFRKKHHEYFNGGQFIEEIIPTGDNPKRKLGEITDHTIKAAIWKSSKSSNKKMIIVNIDNEEHIVSTPQVKDLKIGAKQCLSINLE